MQNINHKIRALLLDMLFPCFCFGCGKEGSFLCLECETHLDYLGKKQRPLCVFNYHNSTIKTMLQAFKYDHINSLDKTLARLTWKFLNTNKIQFSNDWIISFVPMHRQKQNVRGYNQSELLAKELAALLRLPCLPTLSKLRHTRPQMLLNRPERQQNLKNCFAPIEGATGKNIILIDDVCTTGSTFEECRKALLTGGAKKVFCLALARDI